MKKETIDQFTAEAAFGPKKKASSKKGMVPLRKEPRRHAAIHAEHGKPKASDNKSL